MDNLEAALYSIKCGICSFTATYAAGVMHPLDLLKTRCQSHDGGVNSYNVVPKYNGIFQGLKRIHYEEGIKGLYKGFYVSLLSQGLATGFFFWIYETQKIKYQRKGYQTMNAVTQASIQASLIATLITQPLWVLKTRMLLNVKPGSKQISQALQKVKQIYHQNGPKGFLKGLSLSLVLSFSGVLQMYIYEGSKIAFRYLDIQTQYSEQNFICGSLSKFTAVLFTYPITTIRTRIQQNQFLSGGGGQQKYANIRDVISKLINSEGITGFYKGIGANMMKGIPQRGIYFYFYEILKKNLVKEEIISA